MLNLLINRYGLIGWEISRYTHAQRTGVVMGVILLSYLCNYLICYDFPGIWGIMNHHVFV